MRAGEAGDAGGKKLVLAADCLGRQELLLLFRERKRRRNAKGQGGRGGGNRGRLELWSKRGMLKRGESASVCRKPVNGPGYVPDAQEGR